MHKKKKRKKKMQLEAKGGSSADECEVVMDDAREELKQLKLCDEASLQSDTKQKKKKKKKEKKRDQGKLQMDTCNTVEDERWTDSTEMIVETKKRKSKKKKQCLDDDERAAELADSDLPSDAQVSEEIGNRLSDSSSEVEEKEEAMEDFVGAKHTQEEQEIAGSHEATDDVIPLTPLSGGHQVVAKERKSVQRQLPRWITEADIIQDDIIEQSQ